MTVETNKVWVDTTPDRVRKHKLVTEEIAANIPAMGELSEGEDVDFGSVVPAVKLFSPILGWDWYVIEWDAETGVCFGLVHGLSQDFGTFDLGDLASQTMGGIPVVEREVDWPGQTIRELQEMWHGHYPAWTARWRAGQLRVGLKIAPGGSGSRPIWGTTLRW